MLFADERSAISLLNLPVEVLYRICDFLDAETIIFTLRSVCHQLNAVVKSYNAFKIYFRSIRKNHLYRLISPEQIIQLDFVDRQCAIGWIPLFMNHQNIDQFTRLRHLSLYKTNRDDLKMFLHHITLNCQLNSLEIHSDFSNDDEIFELLSLTISQPSLKNLRLQFDLSEKNGFTWPHQSLIKKFTVGLCTIEQICSILDHSPYLQTIVMDNCYVNDVDHRILHQSYLQLTSLVLNDLRMTMNKLEMLLSLVPSLVHLDLTSTGKPFEFIRRLSQWEEFIRHRLPRLSRLEFCIFCYGSNWKDFETLVDMFRTPFWTEEKRWFVTCQFRDDWTTSFTAFTSSELSIHTDEKQIQYDRVLCYQSNTKHTVQP